MVQNWPFLAETGATKVVMSTNEIAHLSIQIVMKQLILLAILGSIGSQALAQDFGMYWKYKDYDGAIALVVGPPLIDIGSLFLDKKDDRKALRHINKVRLLIFSEQTSPVRERDMRKFNRRAARKGLEDMVMVRHGKTQVRVMAKFKRKAIRKVVVLVHEPNNFVMVGIKGRLRWEDINQALNRYKSDKNTPQVPEIIKIPTKRI